MNSIRQIREADFLHRVPHFPCHFPVAQGSIAHDVRNPLDQRSVGEVRRYEGVERFSIASSHSDEPYDDTAATEFLSDAVRERNISFSSEACVSAESGDTLADANSGTDFDAIGDFNN